MGDMYMGNTQKDKASNPNIEDAKNASIHEQSGIVITKDTIVNDSELPSEKDFEKAIALLELLATAFLLEFAISELMAYLRKIKEKKNSDKVTSKIKNRKIALIMAKYNELSIEQENIDSIY